MTLARPRSCGHLAWVFHRMALQGFGGVVPVAQRELVERERWLDSQQFLQTLSMAQLLPGPNVVNLALMVGDSYFGWRGAMAALAGLMAAPLVLVLLLAAAVAQWRTEPMVVGALRGMGIAAAGLVASTAFKLLLGVRRNALGLLGAWLFGGAAFLAIGFLRWPLAWVVLGLGSVAWLTAAVRLRREAAP
jgi:chromate transporter